MGNRENQRWINSRVGKRDESLLTSQRKIKENIEFELKSGPWGTQASPLSRNGGGVSFEASFSLVIPEGFSLKDDIEQTLAPYKGIAIGVEVGGIGSLFSGFSPGFFGRSAGVNLTDYRKFLKFDPTHEDERRNHTVIPGDILGLVDTPEGNVHELVENWLDGEKAHLIMERLLGGHSLMPKDPFFMAQQASFWYRQLAEGGLMYAEVPDAFIPYIETWRTFIQDHYQGRLDLSVVRTADTPYALRLHKLEGAPEELPLLDARTVVARQHLK